MSAVGFCILSNVHLYPIVSRKTLGSPIRIELCPSLTSHFARIEDSLFSSAQTSSPMIPAKRQLVVRWLGVLSLATSVLGVNDDLFNYGSTFIDENGRNSYSQDEWDAVSCSNVNICVRSEQI